jgi:hypothetical protein
MKPALHIEKPLYRYWATPFNSRAISIILKTNLL